MHSIRGVFEYLKKLSELKHAMKQQNVDADFKEVILMDTAYASDNKGDYIIMDYAQKQISALNCSCVNKIPTHICNEELWASVSNNDRRLKIICGTNLLYGSMNREKNWKYPNDIQKMKNCCLLGVGWGVYEDGVNYYTKNFYKYILNDKCIHSVRDMYTYQMLKSIGINNVVYTGCVSMWNFTEDFCKEIPCDKADNVVTTITDYNQDKELDSYMIETLLKMYNNVYIWIQGSGDLDYLSSLVDINRIIVLNSLEEYDECLRGNVEYIGTRLHAGIRALNFKCRACVISFDNRAREISRDTNLPIIERKEIKTKLIKYITGSHHTEICMPLDNINSWKKQFE